MIIVALLLAATPAAASAANITAKPICRGGAMQNVGGRATPGIHPLGDEPPATSIKTVVRTIGACNKPLVVAKRVGAPTR